MYFDKKKYGRKKGGNKGDNLHPYHISVQPSEENSFTQENSQNQISMVQVALFS